MIVGGGAMGTSTAYHLAQLGVTDVVLCERETLGSGSTSKSAGGIRAQFADEINIRIALVSLLEFRNFEQKIGAGIDFRETGYLFLLDSDDDVGRFREAVRLQGSLGVLSTELTPGRGARARPAAETPRACAARPTARATASPRRRQSSGATRRPRRSRACGSSRAST